MDTRQLEMFRAVAEETSFTKAAQRLHVSQSAVSRQLQLLEEELGSRLFHRGARGVSLTPQGTLLLKAAHRIAREMDDVATQLSATQTLQRGLLTLGGGMTVCLSILPKLLRKFRTQYKNVDLRVVTGTTEMILRMLRNREVDVALLTLPIFEPDLEVMPVIKEEMVVVTAGKHPLARGRRFVEPQALARQPLILFESGSNTRHAIDEFFRAQQIAINVVMETENIEIIKSMVASGLGVTVVPYSAIAHDRTRRFAWARLRGHHLYRETGWVHLKSDYMPRAVTEVLRIFDSMKEQFAGTLPK